MSSQREDGRNSNILWNELNPFEISYQALRRLLKQQQPCKSIPPNIHTRFLQVQKQKRADESHLHTRFSTKYRNKCEHFSIRKQTQNTCIDDSCLSVPVTCSISDPLWMFAAFKSEHINEEIGVWLSPITNLEDIKLSKVRIH